MDSLPEVALENVNLSSPTEIFFYCVQQLPKRPTDAWGATGGRDVLERSTQVPRWPTINLRGGKLAILVANFAVGTTDGATWHSAGKCYSRWSKGLARYLRQSGKLCMVLGRPERKFYIICKK